MGPRLPGPWDERELNELPDDPPLPPLLPLLPEVPEPLLADPGLPDKLLLDEEGGRAEALLLLLEDDCGTAEAEEAEDESDCEDELGVVMMTLTYSGRWIYESTKSHTPWQAARSFVQLAHVSGLLV